MRAGAVLLVGIGLLLGACAAPDDERRCPAWTASEGAQCVLRSWSTEAVVLGDPGARSLQATMGASGDVLLAWAQTTTEGSTLVLAQPDDTASWSLTSVPEYGGNAAEPAIAVDEEGRALLAWEEHGTQPRVHLATRDETGAWSWPQAPLHPDPESYEPRVYFGADGEGLVVWNQREGMNLRVAVARRAPEDPTGAFVVPGDASDLLSPSVNFANAPRLALDQRGRGLIAWYQAPVDDLMVFVSERASPDGGFTQPAATEFISAPGGPVDSHAEANPQPALHESGAAAVIWTQQTGPTTIPAFFATRDPDGTWHRPASLDDSLSAPQVDARCPQLMFGPDGSLLATWYETEGDRSEVMVWQQRPGDDSPSEASPLSSPGAQAVHPALAITPDGNAVLVWAESEDEAATWRVQARLYQAAEDRWLPAQPLGPARPGQDPRPQLALGPEDRVLLAWTEGSIVDARVRVTELR